MAPTLTARLRRHILDVDLRLPLDTAAPVTVLFGPSGAGKTTLLRCLAGLERPEHGAHISLGERLWLGPRTTLPARRRRVGYLFQDHALFPHLNVAGNVAYGLSRWPRARRRERVTEALAAARAAHLAQRPTTHLSGGEAQRVALARALAPRPELLLLDEPLSALDAPTRARLGAELRAILRAAGVPTLLVTHDRTEALVLGDRAVLLVDGRAHHVDTVEEVFARPATAEAAAAVGVDTTVDGHVTAVETTGRVRVAVGPHTLTAPAAAGTRAGQRVLVCVRAEDVTLHAGPDAHDGPNRVAATVTALRPDGPLQRVELDAGWAMSALLTRPAAEELALAPGSVVTAVTNPAAIHLIPRDRT